MAMLAIFPSIIYWLNYNKRLVDMMRSGLLITFFSWWTSIYMMLNKVGVNLFDVQINVYLLPKVPMKPSQELVFWLNQVFWPVWVRKWSFSYKAQWLVLGWGVGWGVSTPKVCNVVRRKYPFIIKLSKSLLFFTFGNPITQQITKLQKKCWQWF
jgi:hypothetical protein